MGRFFIAVKAGLRGAVKKTREARNPRRYWVAGAYVTCTHCGGQSFDRRVAQLNTPGMSALNLDWLNRAGVALVCDACSLIQWFAKGPSEVES